MSKIHSFRFGDFECTVLQDYYDETPAEKIFASASEDERNAALADSAYDAEKIQMSMNIIVLEREGQRILIETGMTNNDPENAMLFPLLKEAGISPESIDIVTISHAHGDHYSGMLDAEGNKYFPNADYVLWQKEWDYYSSDEQLARELEKGQERHDFIQQYFVGLAPHLSFVDEENNMLAEGIRVVPSYGHTRYHVRYEVTSQRQTMHILGDAFLHPLCLDNPQWTFPFDHDDDMAIANRRELRDSVGDDLVMVYHFPFPGVGHVVREDSSYRWQAS